MVAQGWFTLPNAGGSWPIWTTFFPDTTPDNAAAIFDIEPQLDARVMQTGEIIQHQGIRIELRSKEYEAGYLKMFNLMEALALVQQVTVVVESSSYVLWSVTNKTGVVSLGVEGDTKRRRLFEMGLTVSIEAL
jgi:hypothetical protein